MKEELTKTTYNPPTVEVMNVRVESGMAMSGSTNNSQAGATTTQMENATWN